MALLKSNIVAEWLIHGTPASASLKHYINVKGNLHKTCSASIAYVAIQRLSLLLFSHSIKSTLLYFMH